MHLPDHAGTTATATHRPVRNQAVRLVWPAWRAVLLSALLFPTAAPAAHPTNVGGAITSNTTWTPDGSPYRLTSDLSITNQAILTIEPGVEVTALGDWAILVGTVDQGSGAIFADASRGYPIVFGGEGAAPDPGSWPGIRIGGFSSQVSVFRNCVFRDAAVGLSFEGYYGPIPEIRMCTFRNNTTGLYLDVRTSGTMLFQSCRFEANTNGIEQSGYGQATLLMSLGTFAGNLESCFRGYGFSRFDHCDFTDNSGVILSDDGGFDSGIVLRCSRIHDNPTTGCIEVRNFLYVDQLNIFNNTGYTIRNVGADTVYMSGTYWGTNQLDTIRETIQDCHADWIFGCVELGTIAEVPNDCVTASGACCFDRICLIENAEACGSGGGEFQGAGSVCSPDPCDPTPTRETTWGRIKAGYR